MIYFRIFYLFVYRYAKGCWKVKMALAVGSVASCIRNMLPAQFSISITSLALFLSVQGLEEGARSSVVVEALCYKPEGRGIAA
jgi:hypothetical protein